MEEKAVTLIERLEQHAESRPQRIAYRFINAQTDETDKMTYAELRETSRRVAAFLLENLEAGDRVAICCKPSLDFVRAYIGCLYAGVIAVPTYPPERPSDWERLSGILKDSGCKALLSDELLAPALREKISTVGRSAPIYVVSEACTHDGSQVLPLVASEDVAFLQYTSGSTGNPKGVVVTHANLMANEAAVQHAFGHDADADLLGWLPMYHDMGLIGIALQPLYLGTTSTLMSPKTFLKSPLSWLRAISRYRPHTSGAPNFAFELCLKAAEREDISELDLSSWRVAFNGAEPIDADTMERFRDYFSHVGLPIDAIYPCYGLAESTLYVSGHTRGTAFHIEEVDREALKRNQLSAPTAGKALNRMVGTRNLCDQDIRIVDPDSNVEKSSGCIGEIWLKNPSVAQGYWGNNEATTRTFQAFTNLGEGPYLRTGDLGALYKGNLFITGRVKDMIILNGRNFYASDIEKAVQGHDARLHFGYGAAFALCNDGKEMLVLVQAVKQTNISSEEAEQVCAKIKRTILSEIGVPVSRIVLIDSRTFPRTSSGKIRRNECRQMLVKNELKIIHEWNIKDRVGMLRASAADQPPVGCTTISSVPQESAQNSAQSSDLVEVKTIIKSWLADGLSMSMTDIPSSATFAEFGIDSVKIAQLVARLEKMYRVEIDPKAAWENPTIQGFSKYVLGIQQAATNRSKLEVAE